VLYPERLPQRLWLKHYGTVFRTVEVNATFYRLPSEAAVEAWRRAVPDDFVFAVKGSRLVTHVRRLSGVSEAVMQFCDRISTLDETLGPVLWQLPPTMKRNDTLLAGFLHVLPRERRHVIEFRHPSWWHPDVVAALTDRMVAICLVDMPGYVSPAIATADFIYARFHGPETHYKGRYPDDSLRRWADRLRDIARDQYRIYAYFNNDAHGHAVENALTLRRLLARP
jgi:uncharacterized protein YecE (DUF72 family)